MTPKTKPRLFVLFIFLVCAAPIGLSTFTYYVWKPQKRMNYGELLQGARVSFASVKALDGQPLTNNLLIGKWVLLLVDQPACESDCERRLYAMRQTLLAMEVKKEKLTQAWMIDPIGTPSNQLLQNYPQTILLAGDPDLLRQLPQPSAGRIFLIDPKGQPVLRYPEILEPARMMKDLGRLLDVKRM